MPPLEFMGGISIVALDFSNFLFGYFSTLQTLVAESSFGDCLHSAHYFFVSPMALMLVHFDLLVKFSPLKRESKSI